MQHKEPKRHFRKRWLFLLLLLLLIPIWILARPETYLPHERIVLGLPFDKNTPPILFIPMGETIFHPDSPKGHPGIDFGWHGSDVNILSSSDGRVDTLGKSYDEEEWDIVVESGYYQLRYKELSSLNPALKVGSSVKKGDVLGILRKDAGSMHWEFASVSTIRDRFCPVTYFDVESRIYLEDLWAKTEPVSQEMKQNAPEICSGGYRDKTD